MDLLSVVLALQTFESHGSFFCPLSGDNPAGADPAMTAKCQGTVLSTLNLQAFWGMKKCSSHHKKNRTITFFAKMPEILFGFVYVMG